MRPTLPFAAPAPLHRCVGQLHEIVDAKAAGLDAGMAMDPAAGARRYLKVRPPQARIAITLVLHAWGVLGYIFTI